MNPTQFKFKPDRIKYTTRIDTLNGSHKKTTDEFIENENNLNSMKEKLVKHKKKIDYLDKNVDKIKNYCDKKSELLDKITKLEADIDQIENHTNELDYFSKVHSVIFNYYSTYDNQDDEKNYSHQAIEHNKQKQEQEQDSLQQENVNKRKNSKESDDVITGGDRGDSDDNTNIVENNDNHRNNNDTNDMNVSNSTISKLSKLNNMSRKKRKEKKETKKRIKNSDKINYSKKKDIFSYIDPDHDMENDDGNNKASLFNEYNMLLNGLTNEKIISKTCKTCNVDKQMIYNEGIYVCPVCHMAETSIIESEVTNYKDPMVEKTTFPYDRKNHFREWIDLNCSQKLILKELTNHIYKIYNFVLILFVW